MFNPFRKEEGEATTFKSGLVYGLLGAVLVLAVIAAVIFFTPLKGKIFKTPAASNNAAAAKADGAKLRVTIVTKKDCANCWDVNLFLNALKQNQVNIIGQDTVYTDDAAGKSLADQYKITAVPTLLISGELDKDANLKAAWPKLGEIINNVFVFRQVIPPYVELATGKLRGQFKLTMLTDKSCDKCYDVNLHQNVLANLGLKTSDVSTVDVSSDEGKALVKKYQIGFAPTIILTGDVEVYQSLAQIWKDYGQVAADGAYIFTGVKEMGTYKDLTKNKVVEVVLPAANANTNAAQPAQ